MHERVPVARHWRKPTILSIYWVFFQCQHRLERLLVSGYDDVLTTRQQMLFDKRKSNLPGHLWALQAATETDSSYRLHHA